MYVDVGAKKRLSPPPCWRKFCKGAQLPTATDLSLALEGAKLKGHHRSPVTGHRSSSVIEAWYSALDAGVVADNP